MCLHQGTSIGAQRVTEGVVVCDEDPGGHFKCRDKDSPEIVDGLDCYGGVKERRLKENSTGRWVFAIQVVGDLV
jgi:hypothetical protein